MEELKENEIIVDEWVRSDTGEVFKSYDDLVASRQLPINPNNNDEVSDIYHEKGIVMDENFDFLFNNGNIRYFISNNVIWFIAKDICDYLEYNDSAQAIKDNVSPFNSYHFDYNTISAGLAQIQTPSARPSLDSYAISRNGALCINERGIYELTLHSKMPKAKQFYNYVCNKVLPCIRRFGMYTSDTVNEIIQNDPDNMYPWWANCSIKDHKDAVDQENALLNQIITDVTNIEVPEEVRTYPCSPQATNYWVRVANTIFADTCNRHRSVIDDADKKRCAAQTALTNAKKAHKEELARRDERERVLRDEIKELKSDLKKETKASSKKDATIVSLTQEVEQLKSNQSSIEIAHEKPYICHIIPDEVRAKLSYEEFKKLRDSIK